MADLRTIAPDPWAEFPVVEQNDPWSEFPDAEPELASPDRMEDLKSALRNVDEAGDVDAARKLANENYRQRELRRRRAPLTWDDFPDAPPEGDPSWTRWAAAGTSAFNRGLANVVGAPVDLVNAGLEKIGLPVSDTPIMGSRWLADRGEDINAVRPTDAMYPTTERIGEMTGEGVGAIATMGTLGAAAPATRAGQVANSLSGPAMRSGAAFAAQVPAEAIASAGSIAGENIGGRVGDYWGGDTGQAVGEAIGAFSGALAPAAGAVGAAELVRRGARRPASGGLTSQDVNDALERSGIELSGGLAGNSAVARTENAASYLPIGGGAVRNKIARQTGQFQTALQDSASRRRGGNSAGEISPASIGARLQDTASGGLDRIKTQLATDEDALTSRIQTFGPVADANPILKEANRLKANTTPAQARIIDAKIADLDAMRTHALDIERDRALRQQASVLRKSIRDKTAQLDTAGDAATARQLRADIKQLETRVEATARAIKANMGVDYGRLRQWRGEIGQRTEAGGIGSGNQKAIYATTTRRLEDIADRAGALDDFNKLTSQEAELYQRRGSLDKGGDIAELRKLTERRDGAAVFDYLAEAGKRRPERLELLKRNADPERWGELSGDILEYFGRAKPGRVSADAEFSPDTFLTNWEAMSERSKDLLAGPERAALDDLATAAKAFRSRGNAGNRSGAIPLALNLGTYGGLLFQPHAAAAGIAAGSGAGRVVSSDGFARFIAAKAPHLAERLLPRIAGQLGRESQNLKQ